MPVYPQFLPQSYWQDCPEFPLNKGSRAAAPHTSQYSPVHSGLKHSRLSAQGPLHSEPPWAAAVHCRLRCWVPLEQVTEHWLHELHSCHCPSTATAGKKEMDTAELPPNPGMASRLPSRLEGFNLDLNADPGTVPSLKMVHFCQQSSTAIMSYFKII